MTFQPAVAVVLRDRRASTTSLQRRLSGATGTIIGYNRCALYMACMEVDGIVGRIDSECRRQVLAWLN